MPDTPGTLVIPITPGTLIANASRGAESPGAQDEAQGWAAADGVQDGARGGAAANCAVASGAGGDTVAVVEAAEESDDGSTHSDFLFLEIDCFVPDDSSGSTESTSAMCYDSEMPSAGGNESSNRGAVRGRDVGSLPSVTS